MVRKIARNNAYIDLLLHDTVYHTAINFPTMLSLFGIAWYWRSMSCFHFHVTLWYMSIGGRVVLAVTFQKVDAAPHAQAAAQGDDQSLQNVDSVSKKAHIHSSFRSVELSG